MEAFDTKSYIISMNKAIIISIDFELAWGTGGKSVYLPIHKKEREIIKNFLNLCKEFKIPCTWATVGNIFLTDVSDVKRRDVEIFGNGKRIYESFLTDGMSDESLWFGEDIIEQILACTTPQEIGCHTFFHTPATETSAVDFKKELMLASRIAKEKFGLTLKSFVYPKNYIAHINILNEVGFTNFRGNDSISVFGLYGRSRMAQRLESLFALPIPPVHDTILGGVRNIPASYFLGEKLFQNVSVPMLFRLKRIERSLKKVVEHGGIFHLWFHPHNLVQMQDYEDEIRILFVLLNRFRDMYGVSVCTMGDYNTAVL